MVMEAFCNSHLNGFTLHNAQLSVVPRHEVINGPHVLGWLIGAETSTDRHLVIAILEIAIVEFKSPNDDHKATWTVYNPTLTEVVVALNPMYRWS